MLLGRWPSASLSKVLLGRNLVPAVLGPQLAR